MKVKGLMGETPSMVGIPLKDKPTKAFYALSQFLLVFRNEEPLQYGLLVKGFTISPLSRFLCYGCLIPKG